MIRKIGQAFVLDTAHTTYAFSILPGGHPEHLYYGRTIHIEHPDDLEILVEKHVFAPGNVNICEKSMPVFRWRMCGWKCLRTERAISVSRLLRLFFMMGQRLWISAMKMPLLPGKRCAGRTSGFLWKCGRSAAAVCDNGGPAV